ncbi:MAG: hypothetical protein QOJ22_488 [Thermoleophilaceae bacterium]|nr:hypothetical protein [Thermoleophilaceae bacterium]
MRCRARTSARPAKNPITTPAGTNLVPSHGSAPSSAKHTNASGRVTRSSNRRVSSAEPASAVAAGSSGYTALPYARTGGESPTASVAPIAHGSGATRSASRYANTPPSAAIAARKSSTPFAPPSANAGAISAGKPAPCGSCARPSVSSPWRSSRSG